jgi:hypothetical protein
MSKVFLISIQKSGTNMVAQALKGGKLLTFRGSLYREKPLPNVMQQLRTFEGFARHHLPWRKEYADILRSPNIVTFFLYRDPRDIIVSWKHWISRPNFGEGWLNFKLESGELVADCRDPYAEIIKAAPAKFSQFFGWLDEDFVHQLRYEDLMKKEVRQLQKIHKLVGGAYGSVEQMRGRIIRKHDPNKNPTFRRGKIGDWKMEFRPRHIKLFKEGGMMNVMDRLGYDW